RDRNADDEKKKRKHEIGGRPAVPLGVFEWPVNAGPRAGIVHQHHACDRDSAKDVERDKTFGGHSKRVTRMNTDLDPCYSIGPDMSLMLAEIAEQPAALERTIASERAKISKLGNLLKSRDIHLIVLVARGSSDNAALFGRYLLEITTGIPVSLSAPSVHTIYNAQLKLDHALVVGVSQSGEGEDINRVLESARQSGAYTIGITTGPGSSMTRLV